MSENAPLPSWFEVIRLKARQFYKVDWGMVSVFSYPPTLQEIVLGRLATIDGKLQVVETRLPANEGIIRSIINGLSARSEWWALRLRDEVAPELSPPPHGFVRGDAVERATTELTGTRGQVEATFFADQEGTLKLGQGDAENADAVKAWLSNF